MAFISWPFLALVGTSGWWVVVFPLKVGQGMCKLGLRLGCVASCNPATGFRIEFSKYSCGQLGCLGSRTAGWVGEMTPVVVGCPVSN